MRWEFVRVSCAAGLASVCAASGGAQTLIGVGGPSGFALEFDLGSGTSCYGGAWSSTWTYSATPPACGAPGLALSVPAPAPALLGDVALDRKRNVVFITDGFVVGEFHDAGGTSVGTTPTSIWQVPPITTPSGVFGPLTGMGFDDTLSILWITDGISIAGLGPYPLVGACATPGVVVSAFAHRLGSGVVLTDITWDPGTWTYWVCDTTGVIHNLLHGGGLGPGGAFAAGSCGTLSGPLQGIAFDLATPGSFGRSTSRSVPTAYVTDGLGSIESIDLTTGGVAPATFYDASPCRSVPMPLNGLAYSGRPIAWSSGSIRSYGYGHAMSPSNSLGIVVDQTTPGSVLWLAYGTNYSGVGYFCPAIPLLGASLHVNFVTPPGGLVFVGASQPAGNVVPLPLAGGLPRGMQIYTQFFEDVSGAGYGPVRGSTPLAITIIDD